MATTATSPYYLTPDLAQSKEAMRQKMAYALMMQGSSGEPVTAWTQGLARMAQGALGGYELYKDDQEEKSREAKVSNAIDTMPGMSPVASALSSDNGPPAPTSTVAAALMPPQSSYADKTFTANGQTMPLPPRNPLAGLDPNFRTGLADLRTAAADKGVPFNVGETVRPQDRQDALYAQGRTAPGPIVTQTQNSLHTQGRAADLTPVDGSTPPAVGAIVQELIKTDPRFASLRSGAGFKNLYDPLHVEQPNTKLAYNAEPGSPPFGVGVPPPSMPAQAQPTPQAPQNVAQLSPTQSQSPQISPADQALIKQLWANPATRPLAMERYQQLTKPKDQEAPLTDPKEREASGISPSDKTPYQRNQATGKITPINTQQQVNIDQRAPNSFEKTYGEGQAKRAEAIVETGDKASSVYQRNQVLRALNNQISTGKITPATATIGAWAKSVGLNPAVLGIDPSLPTNAETFNALSNESMMSKLGPGGFPSQNFSDTDRKFLEKTVTNLGDQPGANELKLAVSDRISQLQMEKADKWQGISTSVKPEDRANAYEKFERDWRKEMKTRDVFGDLIMQIGSKPGAAPSLAAPNAPGIDPAALEEARKRGLIK